MERPNAGAQESVHESNLQIAPSNVCEVCHTPAVLSGERCATVTIQCKQCCDSSHATKHTTQIPRWFRETCKQLRIPVPYDKLRCDRCGQQQSPVTCRDCHVAMYCSVACMQKDVNAHRRECRNVIIRMRKKFPTTYDALDLQVDIDAESYQSYIPMLSLGQLQHNVSGDPNDMSDVEQPRTSSKRRLILDTLISELTSPPSSPLVVPLLPAAPVVESLALTATAVTQSVLKDGESSNASESSIDVLEESKDSNGSDRASGDDNPPLQVDDLLEMRLCDKSHAIAATKAVHPDPLAVPASVIKQLSSARIHSPAGDKVMVAPLPSFERMAVKRQRAMCGAIARAIKSSSEESSSSSSEDESKKHHGAHKRKREKERTHHHHHEQKHRRYHHRHHTSSKREIEETRRLLERIDRHQQHHNAKHLEQSKKPKTTQGRANAVPPSASTSIKPDKLDSAQPESIMSSIWWLSSTQKQLFQRFKNLTELPSKPRGPLNVAMRTMKAGNASDGRAMVGSAGIQVLSAILSNRPLEDTPINDEFLNMGADNKVACLLIQINGHDGLSIPPAQSSVPSTPQSTTEDDESVQAMHISVQTAIQHTDRARQPKNGWLLVTKAIDESSSIPQLVMPSTPITESADITAPAAADTEVAAPTVTIVTPTPQNRLFIVNKINPRVNNVVAVIDTGNGKLRMCVDNISAQSIVNSIAALGNQSNCLPAAILECASRVEICPVCLLKLNKSDMANGHHRLCRANVWAWLRNTGGPGFNEAIVDTSAFPEHLKNVDMSASFTTTEQTEFDKIRHKEQLEEQKRLDDAEFIVEDDVDLVSDNDDEQMIAENGTTGDLLDRFEHLTPDDMQRIDNMLYAVDEGNETACINMNNEIEKLVALIEGVTGNDLESFTRRTELRQQVNTLSAVLYRLRMSSEQRINMSSRMRRMEYFTAEVKQCELKEDLTTLVSRHAEDVRKAQSRGTYKDLAKEALETKFKDDMKALVDMLALGEFILLPFTQRSVETIDDMYKLENPERRASFVALIQTSGLKNDFTLERPSINPSTPSSGTASSAAATSSTTFGSQDQQPQASNVQVFLNEIFKLFLTNCTLDKIEGFSMNTTFANEDDYALFLLSCRRMMVKMEAEKVALLSGAEKRTAERAGSKRIEDMIRAIVAGQQKAHKPHKNGLVIERMMDPLKATGKEMPDFMVILCNPKEDVEDAEDVDDQNEAESSADDSDGEDVSDFITKDDDLT